MFEKISLVARRLRKPLLRLVTVIAVSYLALYMFSTNVACHFKTNFAAVGGNVGAEVKTESCGGLDTSSRWVEIFNYTDIVRWRADTVVRFPDISAEASLRWTDPSHLVVTYRYCRELDDVVRRWRHVEIDYEFVPTEPPRGSICR